MFDVDYKKNSRFGIERIFLNFKENGLIIQKNRITNEKMCFLGDPVIAFLQNNVM